MGRCHCGRELVTFDEDLFECCNYCSVTRPQLEASIIVLTAEFTELKAEFKRVTNELNKALLALDGVYEDTAGGA